MSEFQHPAEFEDDATATVNSNRREWLQTLGSWVSPARPFCFLTLIGACVAAAWLFNKHLADRFELYGHAHVQAAEAVDPNFYELVARPGHTSVLARRLDGAILEIDLKGDKLVYRVIRESGNENAETALLDGDGHLPLCVEPGYSKDYVLQADNLDGLRELQMPRHFSLMTGTVVNNGTAAVLCVADEGDPHDSDKWIFEAHLVDLNSGKLLAQVPLSDFTFDVEQNSLDGTIYLATRDGVFSWRTSEKEIVPLANIAARSMEHEAETNRLLIGGFTGNLVCLNNADNEIDWVCPMGRSCAIKAIALHPENSDECLVAGEFEEIIRIDLLRGLPKATIDYDASLINGMAYSQSGRHLYVAQSNSHLSVWEIERRIPELVGQL